MLARIYLLESKVGNERAKRNATELLFELNKRMALALSPFAFLMMGIPFGFRTSRSETSVGLVVSVILVIGYFVCIFLAEAFEKKAHMHPEILVWIPNVLYQIGGFIALRRVART